MHPSDIFNGQSVGHNNYVLGNFVHQTMHYSQYPTTIHAHPSVSASSAHEFLDIYDNHHQHNNPMDMFEETQLYQLNILSDLLQHMRWYQHQLFALQEKIQSEQIQLALAWNIEVTQSYEISEALDVLGNTVMQMKNMWQLSSSPHQPPIASSITHFCEMPEMSDEIAEVAEEDKCNNISDQDQVSAAGEAQQTQTQAPSISSLLFDRLQNFHRDNRNPNFIKPDLKVHFISSASSSSSSSDTAVMNSVNASSSSTIEEQQQSSYQSSAKQEVQTSNSLIIRKYYQFTPPPDNPNGVHLFSSYYPAVEEYKQFFTNTNNLTLADADTHAHQDVHVEKAVSKRADHNNKLGNILKFADKYLKLLHFVHGNHCMALSCFHHVADIYRKYASSCSSSPSCDDQKVITIHEECIPYLRESPMTFWVHHKTDLNPKTKTSKDSQVLFKDSIDILLSLISSTTTTVTSSSSSSTSEPSLSLSRAISYLPPEYYNTSLFGSGGPKDKISNEETFATSSDLMLYDWRALDLWQLGVFILNLTVGEEKGIPPDDCGWTPMNPWFQLFVKIPEKDGQQSRNNKKRKIDNQIVSSTSQAQESLSTEQRFEIKQLNQHFKEFGIINKNLSQMNIQKKHLEAEQNIENELFMNFKKCLDSSHHQCQNKKQEGQMKQLADLLVQLLKHDWRDRKSAEELKKVSKQ
jgi:hypothetical protein